ncbi:hypothetical protein C0584_01415 [Candidatus Parcubacteria bacterium]|nr:MAG: hypothetical protein C0584_01415 [Candidatus Parcubacteria bacterium]
MANEPGNQNRSVDTDVLRNERMANEMRESKQQKKIENQQALKEEQVEQGEVQAEPVNKETGLATKGKKKKSVSKRKLLLARKLEKKIKKERFDGLPFFSAIILAQIKDIIDILSLGTVGTVLGFVIGPMLGIIMWSVGESSITLKLKRVIIVNVLEDIPFLNILPIWTLVIIYMKVQHDNKVRLYQHQLKRLSK